MAGSGAAGLACSVPQMRVLLAAALVTALAGACGDDGDSQADATPTSRPATTSTTTAPSATTSPTTAPPTSSSPVAPSATTSGAPATSSRIEPVTAADLHASWRPGCPVAPEDLRRITVTHLGFDGVDHTGVLVVHADWAESLVDVFDQLHAAGFPIERMEPVDAFGGSDDASMAVNNTSAFNCRPVTNGTSWSRHSHGTAIDINPRQNPYVLGDQVLPPEGRDHLDRTPAQGRILDGDVVVEAFAAIGWQWGGHWTSPVDYQHFDSR